MNARTCRVLAGLVLAWSLSLASASAAPQIKLWAEYFGSTDAELQNPYSVCDLNPDTDPIPLTDLHRFGVWMELSGLAPNEYFQGVQFDVKLGSLGTSAGIGSFIPNNPFVDPPGLPVAQPIFQITQDADTDGDLQRLIVASTDSLRVGIYRPGEPPHSPFLLGEFLVTGGIWEVTVGPPGTNGVFPQVTLAPNGLNPWATRRDGVATGHPASTFSVGPTVFRCVPEPASVTLAGLAALGLLGLSRQRGRDVRLLSAIRPAGGWLSLARTSFAD